jgi:hypothetical protein
MADKNEKHEKLVEYAPGAKFPSKLGKTIEKQLDADSDDLEKELQKAEKAGSDSTSD